MEQQTRTRQLLDRLEAIGTSLAGTRNALALMGLGSVGTQLDRLDESSGLDFFAIVRAGSKAEYIGDLSWLERAAPVAYSFQNTPDGHKSYSDICRVTPPVPPRRAMWAPNRPTACPLYSPGESWAACALQRTSAKAPQSTAHTLALQALFPLYASLSIKHQGCLYTHHSHPGKR